MSLLSGAEVAVAVDAYVGATLLWLTEHRGGCFPHRVRGFSVQLPFAVSPEAIEKQVLPAMKTDPRLVFLPSYCGFLYFDLPTRPVKLPSAADVLAEAIDFFVQRMQSFTSKGHPYHSTDVYGMLKPPAHLNKEALVADVLAALKAYPLVRHSPYKNGHITFEAVMDPSATSPGHTYAAEQVAFFANRMRTHFRSNLAYYSTDVEAMLQVPPSYDRGTMVARILRGLTEQPGVQSHVDDKGRVCFTDATAAMSAVGLDAFVEEKTAYFIARMHTTTIKGHRYHSTDVKSLLKVPAHLDADVVYRRIIANLSACPDVTATPEPSGRVVFERAAPSMPQSLMAVAPVATIVADLFEQDLHRIRTAMYEALARPGGKYAVGAVRKQMAGRGYLPEAHIFAVVRVFLHLLADDPQVVVAGGGTGFSAIAGARMLPPPPPVRTPLRALVLDVAYAVFESPMSLHSFHTKLASVAHGFASVQEAVAVVLTELQRDGCFTVTTDAMVDVNRSVLLSHINAFFEAQPAARHQPLTTHVKAVAASSAAPKQKVAVTSAHESPSMTPVSAPQTPSEEHVDSASFIAANTKFFIERMLDHTRRGALYYIGDTQALLKAGGPYYTDGVMERILAELKAHPEVVYRTDPEGRGYFEAKTPMQEYIVQHAAAYLDPIVAWVGTGKRFFTSYLAAQLRPIVPPGVSLDDAVAAVTKSLQHRHGLALHYDESGLSYFTAAVGPPVASIVQPSSSSDTISNADAISDGQSTMSQGALSPARTVLVQSPVDGGEVEPEPPVTPTSPKKQAPSGTSSMLKLARKLAVTFTPQMIKSVSNDAGRFNVSYVRAEIAAVNQGRHLAEGHDVDQLTAAIVAQLRTDPRVVYDTSTPARPFFRLAKKAAKQATTSVKMPAAVAKPPAPVAKSTAPSAASKVEKLVASATTQMINVLHGTKQFYLEALVGVGDPTTDVSAKAVIAQLKKDRRVEFRALPRPHFVKTAFFGPPNKALALSVGGTGVALSVKPEAEKAPQLVIATATQLQQAVAANSILRDSTTTGVVAVDANGSLPNMLLQLAFDDVVLLIDCQQLDVSIVTQYLQPVLQSPKVLKVMYDAHRLTDLLSTVGAGAVVAVADIQLLMEHDTSDFNTTFAAMLRLWELPAHPHPRFLERPDFFNQRPIGAEATQAAAATVSLLLQAYNTYVRDTYDAVMLQAASLRRITNAIATNGART
ncbi:hypothetical protein ACHHYP_14853, partial [Achlya hypogyna]